MRLGLIHAHNKNVTGQRASMSIAKNNITTN